MRRRQWSVSKTIYFADSLGGIFQYCYCGNHLECSQCRDYVVKNYRTGRTSCPDGFTNVFLNGKSFPMCWQKCYSYFFSTECEKECVDVRYEAYWCAADNDRSPNNDTGLMFGGVFTSTSKNPITGEDCVQNSDVICI